MIVIRISIEEADSIRVSKGLIRRREAIVSTLMVQHQVLLSAHPAQPTDNTYPASTQQTNKDPPPAAMEEWY